MRTGKELMMASKNFAGEDPLRSWIEILLTIVLATTTFVFLLLPEIHFIFKFVAAITCGLLYVRLFVIYHDYQHRAILQNSFAAQLLMRAIGIYLLAPETIWKRTHEHHHNNNSKLTISGIGSYPTISKTRFQNLTKKERFIYLVNRHPITILLGYLTLFIYWLNLKSFFQSPGKHLDSLFALLFHSLAGFSVWYFIGINGLLLAWIFPFLLAFGMGSYLFYCQHNFPGATFKENQDWTYENAALSSTSFMIMNPVMQWFTGNIGYHHVHHLNSRIPFYRLVEAFKDMPELSEAKTTSWNPIDVSNCFRLKLWDAEQQKMISLSQLNS
ncbi:MAG: fatty acid desaturase [Cyclobacteriaceae bacterium]|nr:fatty acid desaturase [Cyclobacteriaceae bacterium]